MTKNYFIPAINTTSWDVSGKFEKSGNKISVDYINLRQLEHLSKFPDL